MLHSYNSDFMSFQALMEVFSVEADLVVQMQRKAEASVELIPSNVCLHIQTSGYFYHRPATVNTAAACQ